MKSLLRITILVTLLSITAMLFWPDARLAQSQTSAAPPAPTGIIFDYDFSQAANRACSTTITTNCVSGFTFTVTLNNTTVIGTPQAIVLPTTINATGPTTGILCQNCIPALTNLGNYALCIQTNYKDASGAPQSGNSACLTYSIPAIAVNLRTQ